jgi:putative transposase
MKSRKSLYHRHRFPDDIIRHAVWLYYRFCLSYRDVEDLLAERGVKVSYESIRRWCLRFGPTFANRLRKRSGPDGDQWFVDEVFVRIGGQLRYLYRAVDQDGQAPDILVQTQRNTKLSHEPTRQRGRRMRRFRSIGHAQRFLAVHSTLQNLFVIPRHLLRAKHYRTFRTAAFDSFEQVTCA